MSLISAGSISLDSTFNILDFSSSMTWSKVLFRLKPYDVILHFHSFCIKANGIAALLDKFEGNYFTF